MASYYPLAVGNLWTYKMKDGSTYTNTVTAVDGNTYTMRNSAADKPVYVKKDGNVFTTDSYENNNLFLCLNCTYYFFFL